MTTSALRNSIKEMYAEDLQIKVLSSVFVVFFFTSDDSSKLYKIVDTQEKAILQARLCNGYWEERTIE